MTYKLYVGNNKAPKDFTVARHYFDAIYLCSIYGCPDYIEFEDDDFANWLIEMDIYYKPGFIPKGFKVKTKNEKLNEYLERKNNEISTK